MIQEKFIGLGIAGNFTHHLEQAGESGDFIGIETHEEEAPKGIFPAYVPGSPELVGTFPFSETKIRAKEESDLHMEPEVALWCDVEYDKGDVARIVPTHFTAYNDCSIRVEGAEKISHKKNWGRDSKGISSQKIAIDRFEEGGIMDRYAIVSYLRRDGVLHQYGEASEMLGYSYFHTKLLDWIVQQINTQEDIGPLEHLQTHFAMADFPKKLLISIGATRYTPYGERTYLQKGDELFVLLYPFERYTPAQIERMIEEGRFEEEGLSWLHQQVL